MQDATLISIIMPVRNTEKYLRACLDSIMHQTEKHWELICVNNQSTDDSPKILEEFAQKDERIKVFHNSNSDLIKALRMAYEYVSGELVTRMDSDDLMPPARLALMKTLLHQEGKGHICTGKVEYFREDGVLGDGFKRYQQWLNKLTESATNFSEIYKECVIPSPCWMIWKEDLDRCEAFQPSVYPEDYDLCFRFYKYGLKVITSNEVMLKWRDYSDRNSRTDPNYADQLFFDLKIKYFFELDFNPKKQLAIWGAGRKGKELVRLVQQNINTVCWVTESPLKIGHNIYGIILNSPDTLTPEHQVLIAVSNDEEQENIVQSLKEHKIEYFRFC